MSVYSERHLFLKALKRIIKLLVLNNSREGTKDFNEIIPLCFDMESCRYYLINTRDDPIPQSDGIRNLLHQFPDHTFKQIV